MWRQCFYSLHYMLITVNTCKYKTWPSPWGNQAPSACILIIHIVYDYLLIDVQKIWVLLLYMVCNSLLAIYTMPFSSLAFFYKYCFCFVEVYFCTEFTLSSPNIDIASKEKEIWSKQIYCIFLFFLSLLINIIFSLSIILSHKVIDTSSLTRTCICEPLN